jgi:predicted RNA-binding protein with EMAP domain
LKIVVDFVSQYDILEFVQLIKRSKMRGSIRMLVGFLIVFGAVGTIEVNPDADLLVQIVIAIGGLAVMLTGVSAMREDL